MLIDARELPDGHVIEADIAIIGAGAAGITLACELADSGLTVALLESGGTAPDPDVADLNRGASVGFEAPALETSRLRYFGGTTNHWTGQCGPMDAVDFEFRDWVPHSGWPITRADLDPHYARAVTYCQIGPMSAFEAADVREAMGITPLGIDDEGFQPVVYLMSPPTRFGDAWRAPLESSDRICVYLHANVIEIVASETGERVTKLRCGTLTGRRFTARARQYVLATGGIENARILLASRSVVPAGIGNQHDLVGRYFIDHFLVEDTGQVVFGRPETVDGRFHDYWQHGEASGRGGLGLSSDRLRREGILNAGILLWPEPANENFRRVPRSAGVDAFASVARALAARTVPDDFWPQTCTAVNDRRAVAGWMKRRVMRLVQDPGGTVRARLHMEAEQAPNPDSRVMLSTSERDAFDVPRVVLDWRITELDTHSVRRTLEILGIAVGAAGIGRLHSDWMKPDEAPRGLKSAYHHIGTTRMGSDPRTSVVDAECRVHGISNLYVAGSSVFPTAGRANPTLTIVALAVRLAERLRGAERGA